MTITIVLGLVLLLPAIISAQSCPYNGRSYSERDIIDIKEGCAKLQCQNGAIVGVEEACGRDIDGECHYLGSQVQHKGVNYQCVKRVVNNVIDYVLEKVGSFTSPTASQCTAEGKTYADLDVFLLEDGCRSSQCQRGSVVDVSPAACGKSLDGCCHYLNSYVLKDDRVYKCQSRVVSGRTVYEYVQISQTPNQCSVCVYNSKKYTSYDVYNNFDELQIYQCQDGQNILLSDVYRFPFDGRRYTFNTQWRYQDKLYQCVRDAQGRLTYKVVVESLPPSQNPSPCFIDSQSYAHLSVVRSNDGCQINQCQNGIFVLVYAACKDKRGICRPLNTIWVDGSDTFQCIKEDPWGLTIARIVDKEVVPVCRTPAKDIIFILDNSGSIGQGNFTLQKKFTASLTQRFIVGANASNSEFLFGALSFSTNPVNEFDLNTYTTQNGLYSALMAIRYVGLWTLTDKALNYIVDHRMFTKGRPNANDYIILITDGESNLPDKTQLAAKRVRDSNIEIIAVGIGEANLKELKGITNNPNNVYYVTTFDDLSNIEKKLSAQVCTGENAPAPIPELVCTRRAKDIIFVLDNSGSIGAGNFTTQKRFTASFIERFNIGYDVNKAEYLFGAVSFSTHVVKEFDLTTYTSKSALSSALLKIEYVGLWTHTHKAFNYILDNNMFGKGRSEADDVVVLVTDGESNKPDLTLEAARKLRQSNVEVIAVGIGEAKVKELNDITNDPKNVYYVNNFDDLEKIQEKLSSTVCA